MNNSKLIDETIQIKNNTKNINNNITNNKTAFGEFSVAEKAARGLGGYSC